VKATHAMLFEGINYFNIWHNIVNYNNFFRVECQTWLNTQKVDLGALTGMDSRCTWRLMKRTTFTGSTTVAGAGEDVGWWASSNEQQEDAGLKLLPDAMLPHLNAS